MAQGMACGLYLSRLAWQSGLRQLQSRQQRGAKPMHGCSGGVIAVILSSSHALGQPRGLS